MACDATRKLYQLLESYSCRPTEVGKCCFNKVEALFQFNPEEYVGGRSISKSSSNMQHPSTPLHSGTTFTLMRCARPFDSRVPAKPLEGTASLRRLSRHALTSWAVAAPGYQQCVNKQGCPKKLERGFENLIHLLFTTFFNSSYENRLCLNDG